MAKVFISHSSEDKDIILLFKDIILKAGVGLSDDDIFCTSSSESGVPIGGHIPEYIRKNLLNCDCVFLMISENYKHSEICLNEMGAAIVLGKQLIPILLYNYSFEKVGWLIDKNLCVKIDDKERLDEMRDYFCSLGIVSKTNVWNRYKDNFINMIPESTLESEDVLYKGVLEYQQEMVEGMKIYNRTLDALQDQTKKFGVDLTACVVKLEGIESVAERINIAGDMAVCYNKLADQLDEVNAKAIPAMLSSLDAVEAVLKIGTLTDKQKDFFKRDVSYLLVSCKGNISVIDNISVQISAQLDIEHRQIQAKNRVLAGYATLRSVYEDCILRISKIII